MCAAFLINSVTSTCCLLVAAAPLPVAQTVSPAQPSPVVEDAFIGPAPQPPPAECGPIATPTQIEVLQQPRELPVLWVPPQPREDIPPATRPDEQFQMIFVAPQQAHTGMYSRSWTAFPERVNPPMSVVVPGFDPAAVRAENITHADAQDGGRTVGKARSKRRAERHARSQKRRAARAKRHEQRRRSQ